MTVEDLFNNLVGADKKEILEEWLIARHHILSKCDHLDNLKGIAPDSDKHSQVDIIIDDADKSRAMAIARQVALITHCPNFKESDESTRTIISIIYNNADSTQLKDELRKHMGNLLDYCQFIVDGKDESSCYQSYKDFLPLDIAVEIRKEDASSSFDSTKAIQSVIKMSDVMKNYPTDALKNSISIKRSMLINMAYKTGADIDNLPAYDNANVERYSTALDYFFNHSPQNDIQREWEEATILDKLSCLFCADCIDNRLDGLLKTSGKSMVQYIKGNKDLVKKKIEEAIQALALCEHSRWNVEKLILGFRPYNIQERFTIESLFGEAREKYRKDLKKEHVHLDLCSYKNLRRIDPGNIKYDYFLMLAIPHILLSNHLK